MLDNITTVAPDAYPFYDNEEMPVSAKKERHGFDMNTATLYRAVTAAKVAPNKIVVTNQYGRFPSSAIPLIPQAVTNRAETIYYKLYVENDGSISYDVVSAPQPSMEVTNRAATIIYKLYVEDDGSLSYDVVPYSPALVFVTNRAMTKIYRIYVEDDGAISYDLL